MGVCPPKERANNIFSPVIESLQKLEEKQQTEEEERQRRLQAVFEQRIGTSSKDLRITQPVVTPKITEENTKPELMPQLS